MRIVQLQGEDTRHLSLREVNERLKKKPRPLSLVFDTATTRAKPEAETKAERRRRLDAGQKLKA